MEGCLNTQDENNCTPAYACIGSAGDWFKGHAIGWNTGVIAGETAKGQTCKGNWTMRNAFGAGQVYMECDDGMLVLIYFTSQESETGTATGQGVTSDNRKIQGWSGRYVEAFFKQFNGWPEGYMVCGGTDVPLS